MSILALTSPPPLPPSHPAPLCPSPCVPPSPPHHTVGDDDVLALIGDAGLIQVLNLTLGRGGGELFRAHACPSWETVQGWRTGDREDAGLVQVLNLTLERGRLERLDQEGSRTEGRLDHGDHAQRDPSEHALP